MKKILSLLLFIFFIANAFSQQNNPLITKDSEKQQKWVDSVLQKFTVEEKIGQLFMVPAYSTGDVKEEKKLKETIKKYKIGGLIFMKGEPVRQVKLTNEYQKIANVPLLIGFDGEWGLNMRLNNTYKFPWNMTLGAIQDTSLIRKFGEQVGIHCKRVGITMNFAPVVDINTNPNNPIIGNRSFGENKFNVAQKAIAFTEGMQSEHVLACAKHFPGHGDTSTDSHKTLPSVLFDKERIDSEELYPYYQLFNHDVASVMVAHLSVPSMQLNPNIPTSLSPEVVTDYLKTKMGFQGLIITDALNMKGAADFSEKGRLDFDAFMAGNDILLFPQDIPNAIKTFKEAIEKGTLTEERLDYSVRKILEAKYWAGLEHFEPIKEENLIEDLHTKENVILHRELIEDAMTVIQNKEDLIPIQNLDTTKIAYVKLGDAENKIFVKTLQKYAKVDVIDGKTIDVVLDKLKPYDVVILGFHKSNAHPWKSYKFKNSEIVWVQEISRKKKVILDVFTSPYSLLDLKMFGNIESILVSYQNSEMAQSVSAQIIFGALEAKGKLPVSILSDFPVGTGIQTKKLERLSYSLPETVGMNSEHLMKIDSIAAIVLEEKMAPAMQVLVAKNGSVIYEKSFGYQTADKKQKIKNTDVFDVASLTKILATLPIVMQMEEEGKFELDSELGTFMPFLKESNKDTLTVKEVLSHYGRLKAWIPFYVNTLDKKTKKPDSKYYRIYSKGNYNVKVAPNLYMRNDYKDSIYARVIEADQRKKVGYKYSDLPYFLFKKYIEDTYRKDLDYLTKKRFYKSLGAYRTTYNPIQAGLKKAEIVPTEIDDYYRNTLVHGYVHDMGAAMQGGVGGHAGIFANANDIAKIMQMYLQEGYYGGKQYILPETFHKFNHRYFEKNGVRKGVGFDKPQLDSSISVTCGCVSESSFGHSGFTGTYVWADPQTELVYVFLSNRIYPNAKNRGLVKENIRTKIQQIIVDSIEEED
ncbi:glycoside hydrolase family 3 N-terminal domain-containing protein [Aureivirga sp. CE67]|uniref:glycoside hydrolase family 3 N-terminal domain-containing protein n=1 Tax=Aureivirga sp. CE67 TaxID=1788983 RepID=UPI0018C944C3|nr:glycoside hydrolase family 3 N-terminal domain-containing protein [Aureivirga sp. CE67]